MQAEIWHCAADVMLVPCAMRGSPAPPNRRFSHPSARRCQMPERDTLSRHASNDKRRGEAPPLVPRGTAYLAPACAPDHPEWADRVGTARPFRVFKVAQLVANPVNSGPVQRTMPLCGSEMHAPSAEPCMSACHSS
jgi:hypothetical protein